MRKLAICRGVCRVIPEIVFAALFFATTIQAAVLQDFRLGVSEKRTRLVYQLDRSAAYEVNWDSSSVQLHFDDLLAPDRVYDELRRASGGMLQSVTFDTAAGGLTVIIHAKGPFHLRYFDLEQPDRLVVDIYPRKPVSVTQKPPQKPALAKAPVQKEKQPEKTTETKGAPEIEASSADTGKAEVKVAAEPEKTAADTVVKPPPQKMTKTSGTPTKEIKPRLNWLYIVLPVTALLLIFIGFLTLRRASRKENVFTEDTDGETKEFSPEAKFEHLFKAEIQKGTSAIAADDNDTAVFDASTAPSVEITPEEPSGESETQPPDESAHEPVLESETEPTPETAVEQSGEEFPGEPVLEKPETIPDKSDVPASEEKTTAEDDGDTEPASPEETDEPESESASLNAEADLSAEQTAAKTVASSTESAYGIAEPETTVSRRLVQKSIEGSEAQLDFEEGKLIWPVHILDGDRLGRIMVVDDEKEIVSSLTEYLTGEKYEVLGLTDSAAAVDEFKNWYPDLIITDVVMPVLSGVEMVQRLREQNDKLGKIIFLSGRTERDTVSKVFAEELEDGRYEFFRKPLSLVQIGGRIRDYFTEAQEILTLNLLDADEFNQQIQHLTPHQLVALQRFLWDKIFETAANMLGRRIESYYITDRMEPPANYMRRVGCQEREDYCIANICFGSNPLCAAEKIRGELEIMRQIIVEFRAEFAERVSRAMTGETPKVSRRARRREPAAEVAPDHKSEVSPPPRKTLRRLVTIRKR